MSYEVQSGVMSLYGDWMAKATTEEIEFVDRVFHLAEQNYEGGGDVIVETYSPTEILREFDDLNAAREAAGLWVEQNLDARWGADDDPQLEMAKKNKKWKKKKKGDNLRNPVKSRLEYLRGELQAERISLDEIAELQSLARYIKPDDVELLEAAGVPEHK